MFCCNKTATTVLQLERNRLLFSNLYYFEGSRQNYLSLYSISCRNYFRKKMQVLKIIKLYSKNHTIESQNTILKL